jgi:DNA helicase HerA-like ATPase
LETTVLSARTATVCDPIGYIDYDEGYKGEGSFCQLACRDTSVSRGTYVKIGDSCELSFVARIVDGPFHTSKQPFYILELTSMIVNGQKTAVRNRPRPGTPVMQLKAAEVQSYLGAIGEVKLGRLLSQNDVKIALDYSTMTRHIGIFGTTGSGKSNCLQVIAEEASRANRAVVIFDIEGEYVRMDEPTDELTSILTDFGEKREGVKDLRVYVPAPNSSLNEDARKFSIPFAGLDLEIFSEVLGLSPFESVYLFEVARKAKESSGGFQAYDVHHVLNTLKKRIEAQVEKTGIPEMVAEAHMGLYTKLSLAARTGVLDAPYEKIPSEAFCVPGRISVIDISESSDILRNLCVAHFLREIFRHKTHNPHSTALILFVEEIHTFISKGKGRKMLATITMLTEMARQGRKRGLSMGIVSQQPALVPSELVELCNTRFMHKLASTSNIKALQQSTGNVPDSLWSLLPSLGKGEALIASPKLEHAVIAQIRPNKSKRLRVEFS